jgi:hypothetical protein
MKKLIEDMPKRPVKNIENWVRDSSNTRRAKKAKGLVTGFNPKTERLERVEGVFPVTYRVVKIQ